MATQLKADEILFTDINTFDASGNRIIDVESLRDAGKKRVKTGDYWIDIGRYINTMCTDKKDQSIVWTLPIKEKTITSPYGNRLHPIHNEWRMHYGVDLSEYGCQYSPILAAKGGTVTVASYDYGGAGHYVDINHGDGYTTRYLHMGPADSSSNTYKHIVRVGQVVRAGQVIGSVGTSGGSTGEHLHFGMLHNGTYVNPADHINFSSTSIRVQKGPVSHEDFSPLFGYSNTSDYSMPIGYCQLNRRRGLISGSSLVLYENGNMNRTVGGGSSPIGPIGNDTSSGVTVNISLSDNNFSSSVNPYIKNLMINNAYCWAKSKKILDEVKDEHKYEFLCESHLSNWYSYNRSKKYFNYGKIPRKYSIICWESLKGTNEKTRVAVVDDIIGTDVITISEGIHLQSGNYSSLSNSSIDTSKTITNPDGNWGLDKSSYKFLGFIYLLDNVDIDTNCIKVADDGSETIIATKNNKYASLTFAMHDIKHYNKIRLICDINAHDLVGSKSKISGQVCVMASQQVLRYEVLDTNWFETKFNYKPSYENLHNFVCYYPFPNGAIQLVQLDMRDNVDSGIMKLDMTFPLNSCKFNGSDDFNTFSNNEYAVFDRELPLYVSIVPVAYDNDINNSMTVEVTVKKIILYR